MRGSAVECRNHVPLRLAAVAVVRQSKRGSNLNPGDIGRDAGL